MPEILKNQCCFCGRAIEGETPRQIVLPLDDGGSQGLSCHEGMSSARITSLGATWILSGVSEWTIVAAEHHSPADRGLALLALRPLTVIVRRH